MLLILAEPQVIWSMQGAYSDDLISGMVIAAYAVFDRHKENDFYLSDIYGFQGYNEDNGSDYYLIDFAKQS